MTVQDNGESILLEAQRLTHGDRNANYGHPLDDYTRTAALMTALLSHKLSEPITAEEAAACMCAVKLSRHMHRPKRDNMVDLAGYAWAVWACTEERERREVMECKDEGCPHFGRAHYHPLGDGPLEPEGFPGGYTVENGPADAHGQVDTLLVSPAARADLDRQGFHVEVKAPPDAAARTSPEVTVLMATAGPLQLDCGCVKRCKGHPVSLAAAAVDLPPNGPVCVGAGPRDPQGRPYSTTTADAEFPQAPQDYRIPDSPREFDPAD